jgi:AraC-like DNA-binding protein
MEREPHVRTAAVGFSPGYRWRSQGGKWGQILSTSRGTMSVEAAGGVWVVPTTQAIWLPPHVPNAVSLSGRGALRRVYLRGAPCSRVPAVVHVIRVSPLLAELLRRVMDSGTLDHRRVREARLIDVLVDEVTMARPGAIDLPMPLDARALRAAELVRADPAGTRSASGVARAAGASVRTLERLFRRETGLSFGAWRQRARMLHSLVHLANGATVSQTAFAIGYANPSAFVAAFKSLMGATPLKYASPA